MKKPTHHHLDLYYECECGSEVWVSEDEVRKVGKAVCWMCGALLTFQPFTLSFNYSQKTKKTKKKKTQTHVDLINLLCGLGYKKSEAKKVVENGIRDGFDINNPTEFLKKVVG